MTAAGRKIRAAGIFLSVTALLGLGGTALSVDHATQTAVILNKMAPHQIAALTLIPLENTALGKEVAAGTFILPTATEILHELKLLIAQLDGITCQFHSNHASSYLPLAGRLPRDKDMFLAAIDMALSGTISLVPEHRRAL
jgi:hypothetical protein